LRDGWAVESGQYQRSTGRDPEWGSQGCPELQRGDAFYIRAFWELSSCRQYAQGTIGPIPWTAAMAYAEHAGLDREMSDVFLEVVRGLDATWIEWQSQQRKTK